MNARRVLIVDGDAASRNYLAKIIGKGGYETIAVSSGKEALIEAWREIPHVIIIEPGNLVNIDPIELCKKLRGDKRTEKRILVAFGSISGTDEVLKIEKYVDKYIEKTSQGIKELVDFLNRVKTAGVRDTDSELDDEVGIREGILQNAGRVIVFISAKGGVGTSSVCANLAHAMAMKHPDKRHAVVDMVLPMGSLSHIVGYDGSLNLFEASIMPEKELNQKYMQNSLPKIKLWNFQFLAGSPSPDTSVRLDFSKLPHIIEVLSKSFDYIYIDLGITLSKLSIPIILNSAQIIMMISPDDLGMKHTDKVIKYLASKGMDHEQLFPMYNRVVGREGLTTTAIENELGIIIMGAIPYMDNRLVVANSIHQPIVFKYPDDLAAISIQQAVDKLSVRVEDVYTRRVKIV
ncbi:MAG: AAA family ATPase [Anaerolineales bacterium]|nr:AAA family ATPase [Anaerolineales bacterium]